MKLLLLLALVLAVPAQAQNNPSSFQTLGPITSTATSTALNEQTSSTLFHQITWRVSGTISTCTVSVDSAPDGSTWTTGGVISGQTCTSNGSSPILNVTANYVRINVSTLTGGGSITVVYNGYSGSPSTTQVTQGIVTSGLIGQYAMVDASGTNLPDSSGSGNNCTLVASPTIGTQGITFTNASSQYATCPTMAWKSVVIFASFAPRNSGGIYQAILGNNTSLSNLAMLEGTNLNDTNTAYIGCTIMNHPSGTNTYTEGNEIMTSPGMLTYVADASTDHCYVNDHEAGSYASQLGELSLIAGQPTICGGGLWSLWCNDTIYYVLFYNIQLTAAQVRQNYAAISAILNKRGVTVTNPAPATLNTSTANNVVVGVDSETSGNGANTPYPSLASFTSALTDTYTITNLGVSGFAMCANKDMFQAYQNYYNPRAGQNIAVIWGGTNDLNAGTTAAVTLGCLASLSKRLQQAGWYVIVVEMISRTGVSNAAYNTLIRQHWPEFANDEVPLGADPNIGCSGCNTNGNFQVDHIHLITGTGSGYSATGNTLVGVYMAAAINRAGYNGRPVAAGYGAIHSTGNAASISTATLCSSTDFCGIPGMYHIHWDFIQTVACSSVAAGSVTLQITWTDYNGTSHTVTPVMMGEGASAGTPAMSQSFFFQTSLANAWASGDLNVYTFGTVIQYATTFTTCTTGSPQYEFDATVTRIQ